MQIELTTYPCDTCLSAVNSQEAAARHAHCARVLLMVADMPITGRRARLRALRQAASEQRQADLFAYFARRYVQAACGFEEEV